MLDPQLLKPIRRNRLVDWIAARVFQNQPDKGPQPDQKDSTITGTTAFSVQSIFDKYFLTDVERLVIYKDVQEMDEQSEELSTALDTIADNVCSSEDGVQTSIEVVCDDPESSRIIQELLARVDLHKRLYALVRNTLKFGDGFHEIVVNGEGDIVAVKTLPPNTMYRNEDRFGNLVLGAPEYNSDGQCLNSKEDAAFSQVDVQTQRVIAAFYPWQIVHFRHNWDGMSPYGRSFAKVTRVVWRKLKAVEEAMIIGRLTRAYMKLVYHVDTSGLDKSAKVRALTEFRDNMTQRITVDGRRESQFSVMSDIFLSSGNVKMGNQVAQEQTKVEILDPKNEGLQNIGDMEFFHRKMLSTIRVPPAHMGFEKDVNAKATLTLQDVQYVRFLRRVQQNVGGGLEQIIDTQLILKNKDPKAIPYLIRWPRLSATDEAISSLAEMQRATGDQVYKQEGVISNKFIQRTRFGLDDDAIAKMEGEVQEDVDKANAQAEAEAQRQIGVKNAQAMAVSKGRNNGGDTSRGNPPPGSHSVSHDRDGDRSPEPMAPGARAGTHGVNPPTTRALRQEVVELFPAFLEAIEHFKEKNGGSDSRVAVGVDPLLEEARLAIAAAVPMGTERADPSVHVHFEEGMLRLEQHTAAPVVNVHPEVKAPDVHVQQGDITVEGAEITIEPAPLHQAPAPNVTVEAAAPAQITVQPADVKVEVIKEGPQGDIEVVQETGPEGQKVYRTRRKQK